LLYRSHGREPLEQPCAIYISFSKKNINRLYLSFFFLTAAGDYSTLNAIRRDGEYIRSIAAKPLAKKNESAFHEQYEQIFDAKRKEREREREKINVYIR